MSKPARASGREFGKPFGRGVTVLSPTRVTIEPHPRSNSSARSIIVNVGDPGGVWLCVTRPSRRTGDVSLVVSGRRTLEALRDVLTELLDEGAA